MPWEPAPPIVESIPDRVAGAALIAVAAGGFLAQYLFTFQLLGVNFPIWLGVVLLAAWRFRPRDVPFDRIDAWLPAGAIVFATFVALREDGMLLAFDIVAACSLTLASVVAFGGHAVTRGPWLRVVGLGARSIAVYLIGAAYLLPGLRPIVTALTERRGERLGPVLRGLALAIPLVIVFAGLFAAADAIFQAQLRNLVDLSWIGPESVVRTAVAFIAAWLFGGTLVAAWLAHRPQPSGIASRPGVQLGATEALVVLLALDAVFMVFALLQAAYLFGGMDTFALSGMNYSDYARRGFFELIIAAFLAGGVIVVIDRVVAKRGRAYRLSAAALAAMTGVVALSAFVRLGLYQAVHGWTELRFYALVAIAFLGVGVVLTLAAVLANRARWLPQMLLGAGLLVAIGCNLVGPQVYVTEQNIRRAIDPSLVAPGGKTELNIDYLWRLGADSVPALIAARGQLPPETQARLDPVLGRHAENLARDNTLGWPSWNLARQRALDALIAAGY